MSLRLALLPRILPERAKLRLLDRLARTTAEGFEVKAPTWTGGSFDARLRQYAEFTAQEAGLLADCGDETAIAAAKERLRSGAQGLGEAVRRGLLLRRPEDAFDSFRLLYHEIGIEVNAGPLGEITIDRCFFADYYTESVCEIVVALDQGLAAGLFDGASLEFRERLTGGKPSCRAFLCPGWSEE
jgi:hypothetical protein